MNTVRTAWRVWTTLLLAGLLTLLLAPLARAADPVAITAGAGADWGVKTSFRNYVRGPIAHGSYTTGEGASENTDGTFHFPVAGGEYAPDTRATVVRFGGFVRFTGHDGQLDMRVSNPRVEITPEGADLYADVVSKPNIEGGAPAISYPNTRFASLDATGLEPDVVAGATTTWPALPAALAPEGVQPFAGFYLDGTALDPIGFAYDGPGGTPVPERWTAPGTDKRGALVSGRTSAGVASFTLGWDDRLWFSNYDRRSVATVDATTLEPLRTADVVFNARNVAVDAARRTAYVVDNAIKRITEPAGDLLIDPTPFATLPGTASNELVVRPDGALFTIFDNALHRYSADGSGHDAWLFADEGLGNYSRLKVTADGRLFLYGIGIVEVTFDGAGEPTFTTIVASPTANNVAVAADGTLTWVELDYTDYPTVVRWLHVLRQRADGGYEADVRTSAPTLGWIASAVSPDGRRFFVTDSTNNKVQVVEDGVVTATVAGDTNVSLNGIVADADGNAYASWRDGSLKLIGHARSPTPTTQPQSAAVELPSPDASAEATFSAAATGSPAPTIAWQVRTAGSSRWLPVPGATGEQLTVTATTALDDARYRAVFTNAAGSIASEVATLSVTVTQPRTPDDDPPARTGNDAPAPSVTPLPAIVDPPARTPPTATTPGVTGARGALTLDRSRRATVATIACRAGASASACRVTTPKRVTVKIGGKRFTLTVTAPRSVAAGKRGSVRVQLPEAASARLAGKRVTVKVKLTVTSGGRKVTRTVTVTLKGAKVKKTR